MTQAATDTKKKNGGDVSAAPPPADLTPLKGGDGGFREVKIDRPMFKAEIFLSKKPGSLEEIYEGPICQGNVTGYVEMPETLDETTGVMRQWFVYVLELTAPCKGVDRDVQVDLAVGDQVLVSETTQLRQAVTPIAANHPTHMAQIQICPISRGPMPDDKTKKMWKTKVFVHPTLVPRKQSVSGNSILAGLAASAKTAQLAG